MTASPVIVRDPVWGDIELTREEIRLIDTATFQRLRGIKQLGTAYLVFPGATHTRFEHSIGTLHMVDRVLTGADRHARRGVPGSRPVGSDERRVLRIAALLHDVAHVPFGHNIEDQTGLLERHDSASRYRAAFEGELGAELERLGVRDEVLAILTGEGPAVPPFWRQVLSDTIDGDLLDYLRRDAHYTGLELRYDRRVCDYFHVDAGSERLFVDCAKQGMLREDIVSELTRVLEMRYHFSERVYYHHAKVAAGALLARMVELALRDGALSAADLHAATDDELIARLGRLELGDTADTERLRRFAGRFRRRELPKRVLVLPQYANRDRQPDLLGRFFEPAAAPARRELEARLEEVARACCGGDVDVIVYCPARAMQLKEVGTPVRWPGSDEIRELSAFEDSVPRLRDLAASYPRLWKLYVLCSEPSRDARRKLQAAFAEELPAGCVNALRL